MNKKKIMSLIMALVMLVGVFSPLSAFADNANEPGDGKQTSTQYEAPKSKIDTNDVSEKKPGSTTVIVHKLQADSYYAEVKNGLKHDGGQITNLQGLGKNVKELDGVTFTYYKLKDETQLKDFIDRKDNLKTKEDVEKEFVDYVNKKGAKLTAAGTITTANGAGATVKLTDGYYWFVESGKPATVSSSIAVPFGISIPLTNQVEVGGHAKGTVYLSKVHIYPKNVTGNEPEPDKTVGNLVNKHESHDVGDTVTWYMNATIPSNIGDYKKFEFTDTLKEMLDYVGNIEVKYGSADKTEFKDLEHTLTATTHYTVENYDQQTRTFAVKLTEAGIKEIADNIGNIEKAKISVKFDTTLNDKAKVNTGNPNEYTLIYNNGNGEDKKKKSDEPKVFTGSKKFVKTDSIDRTVLDGAEFIVQNVIDAQNIKYLVKDTNTGKITWTATKAEATVFKPTNGEFEVGKLEFSKKVKGKPQDIKTIEFEDADANKYQLVEIKAPDGYAKQDDPIDFIIDNKSSETGEVKIDNKKAVDDKTNGTHQEIKNKKLTIPQTGGMGTVLFTVVGISLMAGAVVAMKRNREEA